MSIELDESALGKRVRGPDLYYASAMPSGAPKAVLGILHGYADHGARYRHVMGALAEHQIGSVALDMRGHGRALGPRGYCERWDEFLDDARELRNLVDGKARAAHPSGVPTFLFGHSFGGLVASASVLDDPGKLRGLVLTGPFFHVAVDVPRVKLLAGRVASRIYPQLGLPSGLTGKDLTHDADKARGYDEDPLVFKNATARWYTETTKAQERALADAPRLRLPLLLMFGTGDRVVSMSAAKKFFDAAGSTDKTWDARDGLYHEVLNEPSWKDLVDVIARWILARA
jgi:alpha-beta hydrolase superfamily lysophospholipase